MLSLREDTELSVLVVVAVVLTFMCSEVVTSLRQGRVVESTR